MMSGDPDRGFTAALIVALTLALLVIAVFGAALSSR